MILSVEQERLWERIDVRGADECWEWTGSVNNGGYGTAKMWGKNEGSHRAAWMAWNSASIPAGLYVLHSCDNRRCCNPHHLRLGTQKENLADAVARRRLWMQKVTHCPQGHEYDEANTMITKVGKRGCKACLREKSRARYANPEYAAKMRQQNREKYKAKHPNMRPRRSKYDKLMAAL